MPGSKNWSHVEPRWRRGPVALPQQVQHVRHLNPGRFFYRMWYRNLPQNCVLRVISKHLCDRFRCRILKIRGVWSHEGVSEQVQQERHLSTSPQSETNFSFFEGLHLDWTAPESGATVVQIHGLQKDELVLCGGLVGRQRSSRAQGWTGSRIFDFRLPGWQRQIRFYQPKNGSNSRPDVVYS